MTKTTEFGQAVEELTLLLLYLASWEEAGTRVAQGAAVMEDLPV